ncbi:sulfonate transport system permease protein [Lentzea waywayandensis]|uniref:Sulfonate transport system permease protein n=1 Tax=Lentzea waywayandensis TaxID=84724 RepID=A0A1I6FER7_9PSEU|nr:ABC transporter permease [Lentzea waywayandensis]SFR28455.1 sulfonate transport system permease protein [Lentzea waywayandensis]
MTHVLDRPATITTPAKAPKRKRLGLGKPIPYGRVLGPALVIAVWSITSATGALDPRILSAPWTIIQTGFELTANGKLPESILTSLQRAALGFFFGATAGTVLAILSGLSRVGEALIDGTVQVKRAIPSLGLIPLLILWLGIGEEFKIVVIAVTVATIMYLQTYAALTGIDSRYVELAEAVGLKRTQYVRKVVFPGALPGFFLGLRLAVTASWLSLVVLEQINATSGIGYLMFQAQNYGQTDVIVVGLVVYGLFGFVSDALLRIIERRALAWRRTLSG